MTVTVLLNGPSSVHPPYCIINVFLAAIYHTILLQYNKQLHWFLAAHNIIIFVSVTMINTFNHHSEISNNLHDFAATNLTVSNNTYNTLQASTLRVR